MSEGRGLAPGPGCSTEHPSAGASPRPSSEVPALAPASLRAPGVPRSKPPPQARSGRGPPGGAVGAHGPPGARAVSERGQAAGNFSPLALAAFSPPRTARRPLFLRGGDRISPRPCDARGARPGPGPCALGAAPARGCARKARRGARRGRARARRAGRLVRRPSAGARRGRRGPPSFLPGRGPAGPPRPDPYGRLDLRAAKSQRETPGPRVSARRGEHRGPGRGRGGRGEVALCAGGARSPDGSLRRCGGVGAPRAAGRGPGLVRGGGARTEGPACEGCARACPRGYAERGVGTGAFAPRRDRRRAL